MSNNPTLELNKLRNVSLEFVSMYWAKDEFPDRIIIYDFGGRSDQETSSIIRDVLERDVEIKEDTIDSFKYPFLTRKLIYESIVKYFKSEQFSKLRISIIRRKVGSFLLINSYTITDTVFYRLIPRLSFDVKFYFDDERMPIYLLVLDLGVHIIIKISMWELIYY